jgi:hypothetical protein
MLSWGFLHVKEKFRKDLVVKLMSLLEVLQKGLPDGTHHCMAAQNLSKGIPSTHYRFMVCSSVDPTYCGWNVCSGIESILPQCCIFEAKNFARFLPITSISGNAKI